MDVWESLGYVIVQLYILVKHMTEFAILDAQHVDNEHALNWNTTYHLDFMANLLMKISCWQLQGPSYDMMPAQVYKPIQII